jgi:hypothetical protein
MPWLLDGNNLAGGTDRPAVRRAALALARHERLRVVLFFDGAPPPGGAAVERLGAVEVRYAPSADAAILEHLRGGGRGWRLATDDRALGLRAKASGAEVVSAERFWARVAAAAARSPDPDREVAARPERASFFAEVERLPAAPRRVPRRPSHGRRR